MKESYEFFNGAIVIENTLKFFIVKQFAILPNIVYEIYNWNNIKKCAEESMYITFECLIFRVVIYIKKKGKK